MATHPSSDLTSSTEMPTILRQRKFPHRRHIARSRASLPAQDKRQATLTQSEWLSTPAWSDSRDVISVSSDELSDENGEFQEPRPKKKLRRTGKQEDGRGQSTLTQLRWTEPLPSSSAECVEVHSRELKHDEGYRCAEVPRKRESKRQDQARVGAVRAQSRNEGRQKEAQHVPRPVHTPKRRRKLEIPSSETPPSLKVSPYASTRSLRSNVMIQRSPLKERSTNIPVEHTPSKSQRRAVKQTQTVHFTPRKVPLNDDQENVATPHQQSQDKLTDPRVAHGLSISKPRRKVKRANTIQDSQVEELDLDSQVYKVVASPAHNNRSPATTQTQYSHSYYDSTYADMDEPNTFDPANSALDRDAARYFWTQTQQAHTPARRSVADSDSDGDGEDVLDLIQPQLPSQELGNSGNSVTIIARPVSPQGTIIGITTAAEEHRRTSRRLTTQTTIPDSQPSSPPSTPDSVLRPSQISTVVPTQASETHQSDSDITTKHVLEETVSTVLLEGSAQHTELEQFSSSPFPLPPWSSPERLRCEDTSTDSLRVRKRHDLSSDPPESLVDFSLPPPPPLFRSSSPVQEGS